MVIPMEKKIKRVLLVEDNLPVLQALCEHLSEDFDVISATNGEEALELLSGEYFGKVNIVVTDIIMPIMDGLELTKKIKKDYPGLPVIVITGYSQKKTAKAAGNKADYFLKKPFDVAELIVKINEILNGKGKK